MRLPRSGVGFRLRPSCSLRSTIIETEKQGGPALPGRPWDISLPDVHRVLLIILNPPGMAEISYREEIRWISQTFHTEILSRDTLGRPVTASAIFSRTNGRIFDIIHIAGHGGPEGVLLEDNALLSMDELSRLARTREAELLILNTCSSGVLAQYCIDTGVPAVLAYNSETPDVEAWSIIIAFYDVLLKNGGDLTDAYHIAKPRNGRLSLWLPYNGVGERAMQPVLDELGHIRESVDAVRSEGHGRENQIAELRRSVRRIAEQIDGLDGRVAAVESREQIYRLHRDAPTLIIMLAVVALAAVLGVWLSGLIL